MENEYEILNSINNLIKDKTVIIIAHRMETIKNADHSYRNEKKEPIYQGLVTKELLEWIKRKK